MIQLLPIRDSQEQAIEMQRLLDLDRGVVQRLGLETVYLVDQGEYTHASGSLVDIRHTVAQSMSSMTEIPPEVSLPVPTSRPDRVTRVEIANETTLGAAARLARNGQDPLALNMANGVMPGGGFLHGSRAQEEYLCRSTALWTTIKDGRMYAEHAARGDYASSDWMMLSPGVPVIRDDEGNLLERPWLCSIVTSAAPVAHRVGPDLSAQLLAQRIRRLLQAAVAHGYESLVLGAWGCGAYSNDPHRTALAFRSELERDFDGAFAEVIFAITDWSDDRRFLGPFARAFTS